jgi:hypothetical protein
VTEREHAQRLLARLPDSELEIVGGFLAWRDCLADVDEWGDLRALNGGGGVFRHLDEAERAEFGETLWESWQRLEREGKIDPQPPPPPEPPPTPAEEAHRRRKLAEGLLERIPPSDMAVVLAFLAWRGRHSLRPRGGPAVRMAAAGAEAMRLLGELERKLIGKRIYGKTKGGTPIDEELVEKLAAEAEEGYDVEETQRRPGDMPK